MFEEHQSDQDSQNIEKSIEVRSEDQDGQAVVNTLGFMLNKPLKF